MLPITSLSTRYSTISSPGSVVAMMTRVNVVLNSIVMYHFSIIVCQILSGIAYGVKLLYNKMRQDDIMQPVNDLNVNFPFNSPVITFTHF